MRPLFERMTLRNAWANVERVICRYQPPYCRPLKTAWWMFVVHPPRDRPIP